LEKGYEKLKNALSFELAKSLFLSGYLSRILLQSKKTNSYFCEKYSIIFD